MSQKIIDADYLRATISMIGVMVSSGTRLCLIGSAPAILCGQSRFSEDIDIWHRFSVFDETELVSATTRAGLSYNPTEYQCDDDLALPYLQIVRPGIVRLPLEFPVEVIGQYGNLSLVMPIPSLIIALKLVRGNSIDIEDALWWMEQRHIGISDIEDAIALLPDVLQRENATGNLVFLNVSVARSSSSLDGFCP